MHGSCNSADGYAIQAHFRQLVFQWVHFTRQQCIILNVHFKLFSYPAVYCMSDGVLYFQFYYLAGYYQALLVAGMILLTIIEVARLYLGYIGNLREKVIQTNILSEPRDRSHLCACLLNNAAEEAAA